METEAVRLEELKPHSRNYNRHPESQLKVLRESLKRHGVYRNIVVTRDLTILAGHGVVEAAKQIGLTELPVYRVDLEADDPRALEIIAADNEIARMAEPDEQLLADLLTDILEQTGSLEGTGFDANRLDALKRALDPEPDETYARTANAPQYEPSGVQPPVPLLFDATKTEELREKIEAAELPPLLRDFLIRAAQRHTRFRYDRIADYYAGAPADVQRLFEESALVIIDREDAIRLGYAKLADALSGMRVADEAEDDEAEAV